MAENLETQPRIFTAIGFAPEPGGYALAKFSRSADPYEKWIFDLTQKGAQRFYDTYYFQYGHKSIADLTHINLVVENIPLVLAVEVFDEALVDGQESSTRYQDYSKRRFAVPDEIKGTVLESPFHDVGNNLFDTYLALREPVSKFLLEKHADKRPGNLTDEQAVRVAHARTFDRIRYLLPASTYTGLGVILSARTAEKMIIRMLSHPTQSVRNFGESIRAAIKDHPAYNPLAMKVAQLLDQYPQLAEIDGLREQIAEITLQDTESSPTLVKYTDPSAYQQSLYGSILQEAADKYLVDIEPEGGRGVTLHTGLHPEIEVAATVLYRGSRHSFSQALEVVGGISAGERKDLIDLLYQNRGPHDEPVRETLAGRGLVFDIVTDYGAFRDLNRHRNCIKIIQNCNPVLGYDLPPDIDAAGVGDKYREVVEQAQELAMTIEGQFPGIGRHILPLASHVRFLMKMDTAQLQYVVENRTTPEGHFSYRQTAYQMYELAQSVMPNLTTHIRAVHPSVEDFWRR